MGNSTLEVEMTQGRKEDEELFRSKLEVCRLRVQGTLFPQSQRHPLPHEIES